MIAWLWDLLFHRHQWVVHERFPLTERGAKTPCATQYIQRCTKCGTLKSRKL